MKKIIIVLIFLINLIGIPMVNADSGLDANYDSKSSSSDIFGAAISGFSSVGELITAQPGDESYDTCHIIISIICIIIFYIITNVYIFKFDKNKPRKAIKAIIILLISLIPTLLFSVLCLLTSLPLILYLFILGFYIVLLIIVINIIIKSKIKIKIAKIKEIDKDFNENEFNKEAFIIYNEIQLAWMNFELDKVKNIMDKELYNKYQDQLITLKNNKEKNIMKDIKYISNKILDISILNNIEIIKCEMKIKCYDYIINEEGTVIKGKEKNYNNYLYELTFNKDLSNNKYVLTNKKILKQK